MSIPIQNPGSRHGPAQPDDARPIDTSATRATDMSPVARIEQLQHAIAVVRTLDEAKGLRDLAVTIEVYAKRAVLSRDIALDAAEVRLLAEQAVGRKLQAMEKSEGGRPSQNLSCDTTGSQTLKNLGITRDQASRWQRIAGLPPDALTRYFEKSRLRGQPVTTSGAVRLAMERVDRARRRDDRHVARTRAGATSCQVGDDADDSQGRRPESNLECTDDHEVVTEELDVHPDDLPDAGVENEEYVDRAVPEPKVEIVTGSPARRPARPATFSAATGARPARQAPDLDQVDTTSDGVPKRDDSRHDEPRWHSASVGHPNKHYAQFSAHLQQARQYSRWLNPDELQGAARDVESLACELSDTMQALREAEPSSAADESVAHERSLRGEPDGQAARNVRAGDD